MTNQPSYVGMLTAIAAAEHRTHAVLSAWRDVTEDKQLATVLDHVAGVELAHANAFSERLQALGFAHEQLPAEEYAAGVGVAMARSAASEVEKFQRLLGYDAASAANPPNPFAQTFDDPTIDPDTGALLGRFIAEERDSERRLRAEFARIEAAAQPPAAAAAGGDSSTLLADLASCLEQLGKVLEGLKQR